MRCHRGVRQRVVFVEVDVRPEADHDLDVFADQPIQHHPHVGHHHIQVERRRGDDLLAAEGQQLARQLRGANAGQPGVTIGGFQQAMAATVQQCRQRLSVARQIVHDQNGGHGAPAKCEWIHEVTVGRLGDTGLGGRNTSVGRLRRSCGQVRAKIAR